MTYHTRFLVTLLVCFSFGLLNAGIINSAHAEQKNIYGKITEVIEAPGYTYVEVDTDIKKFWAAGPTTPLKIGDMIEFSTEMPMANFHSKSLKRDFPTIYFVNRFITK